MVALAKCKGLLFLITAPHKAASSESTESADSSEASNKWSNSGQDTAYQIYKIQPNVRWRRSSHGHHRHVGVEMVRTRGKRYLQRYLLVGTEPSEDEE